MKISISALSLAYGLTPEALRYYEEKGLLSPERKPESGFRRFSLADAQRLGIIKSLQRQGFSLEEIRRVLAGCPANELLDLLDAKRAQMRQQLIYTRAMDDRLSVGADLLRDSQRLLGKPRLTPGCAAYVTDYESVQAMWSIVPQSPLLRALIDALPLSSYCTVVPLACLRGEDAPLRVGIAAPAEYAAAIRADFSSLRLLAGPRAVRLIYALNPPQRRALLPAIQTAQAFMAQQGLTPVCDGYTRQYMWFVDEQGERHHYGELYIPVAD